MNTERVTLKQEDSSSPNKFSKTFGREKTLDKLLQAADDKELLDNLGSDKNSAASKILNEQPAETKRL
jgi:hypothetical protein